MIALKHLNVISSSHKTNKHSRSISYSMSVVKTCLILLFGSLVINTPYIFIFKIENYPLSTSAIENSSSLDNNNFILTPDLDAISDHPFWLKSIAVVYFLKDTCCLAFICVLNIMISLSLRNGSKSTHAEPVQSARAKTLSTVSFDNETQIDKRMSKNFKLFYRRKERKVSHMILFLSILLLVGNLPETVYRMKRKLNMLFFTKFNYLAYYLIISNIISFVSAYFKLFIYLYFSKTFLEQFRQCFLKCRLCVSRRCSRQN